MLLDKHAAVHIHNHPQSLAVAIEKYKEWLHGDSTSNMHLSWANLQTRMNVGAVEKVKIFIQMQQEHDLEQA